MIFNIQFRYDEWIPNFLNLYDLHSKEVYQYVCCLNQNNYRKYGLMPQKVINLSKEELIVTKEPTCHVYINEQHQTTKYVEVDESFILRVNHDGSQVLVKDIIGIITV